MRRSRPMEILNRDIVPIWLRPFTGSLAFAFYCVAGAWSWAQTIFHWRRGLGLFGVDLILAIFFTVGIIAGLTRLRMWRRDRTRQRHRTAMEAMRPSDFDDKCARCGYDLTGAPSLNCPECGAWHGRRRSRARDRKTL